MPKNSQDWDARYASAPPNGLFGPAPNAYLRTVVERDEVAVSGALCLADGDGRNARWLARQGVAVTAMDLSGVATARALTADAAVGVTVARSVGAVETWCPPAGQSYGLVALIYLQAPDAVRDAALRLAFGSLRPGGWLIVEGFARRCDAGTADLDEATLGPPDDAVRYDAQAARRSIDAAATHLGTSVEVIELWTGTIDLDEGDRHRGRAFVLRLLARRAAG